MYDTLDLVDEMQWEASEKVKFVSLDDAGLELREWDTVPRALLVYYFNEEA